MATVKVSALTETTSPNSTDELLVNQGGTSKKLQVGNLPAATPADASITYAKIQNVSATDRILGRDTTGAGDVEEITPTNLRTMINVEDGADVTDSTNVVAALTAGTNVTISSGGTIASTDTNTTYSVQDGELSENSFTDADHTKLNNIEASADVTDATNVASAGALMDSEVTNLADVKAFDTTDYATSTQGTTADDALPKAGGTMTGTTAHGDNIKATYGNGNDLEIYHDGTNSYIKDVGTGTLVLQAHDNIKLQQYSNNEKMLQANTDGSVQLFHNGVEKFQTSANGVVVTGTAVATTSTDATNTGSVTLDFAANQNFVLTLTGNVTLANPTTEQVGQSGFIAFIQDGTGSRTVGLGTDYETAGAAGLTLTATASATDLVPYLVVASGRILLGTPQLAFA